MDTSGHAIKIAQQLENYGINVQLLPCQGSVQYSKTNLDPFWFAKQLLDMASREEEHFRKRPITNKIRASRNLRAQQNREPLSIMGFNIHTIREYNIQYSSSFACLTERRSELSPPETPTHSFAPVSPSRKALRIADMSPNPLIQFSDSFDSQDIMPEESQKPSSPLPRINNKFTLFGPPTVTANKIPIHNKILPPIQNNNP
jgi:hypothetical protein